VDRVEVVTVGHAIVDVLAAVTDEVVAGLGLTKGTMTLVDDERAESIYRSLEEVRQVSGGSAANTAVALASLGRRAGFVGKVRDDELGGVFASDIAAAGVHFAVPAAGEGPGTGRSMVLVTPDAEKTMCTCLGAGERLVPEDIDAALLGGAATVYLEGYLCGLPHTDPTVRAVLDAAAATGTTVALSLSDPSWVDAHRDAFRALLPSVDVLFANEQEACRLTDSPAAPAAVDHLAGHCRVVVVTCGAAGALLARGSERVEVAAFPVERVEDTTGAGDTFAAGVLHGLLAGVDLRTAGELGAVAAGEVVSHLGARPVTPLRDLARRAGLL
jgi:sugar/nucleoside kinase (ribokinase family)